MHLGHKGENRPAGVVVAKFRPIPARPQRENMKGEGRRGSRRQVSNMWEGHSLKGEEPYRKEPLLCTV
jgi:hypothetical protein